MHRPYPLPLEKPSSLTLSCGLGFGFRLMVLAYFLDHYVTFQGISLDFLYLVRGWRRQSPKVRGVKGGRRKIQKKKKPAKRKKKSGNLMKIVQTKFQRDPRKKKQLRAKSQAVVKAINQVRDFIMIITRLQCHLASHCKFTNFARPDVCESTSGHTD